ncbi:hypothetical protein PENTCL1PPCAC_9766, partial [Pristionchus entomophagus]
FQMDNADKSYNGFKTATGGHGLSLEQYEAVLKYIRSTSEIGDITEQMKYLPLSDQEDAGSESSKIIDEEEIKIDDKDTSKKDATSKKDLCITWNMGSFNGSRGGQYKKRSQVLHENTSKNEPLLVKLNEIKDTTEKKFLKFARDTLKYEPMAMTHSIQSNSNGLMYRAAAILVRNDSIKRFDSTKTIQETKDGFSIAAVYDTEHETYHISCYIHHDGDNDEPSISKGVKLGKAIGRIKEKICENLKIDEDDEEGLSKLRIIISGDFNCNYPDVEAVCSEKAKTFVYLKDLLLFSWHTRSSYHSSTTRTAYTKIDYVLGANVLAKIHMPKIVDYDHYMIFEDIYHAVPDKSDPSFKNPYCDSCYTFDCTVTVTKTFLEIMGAKLAQLVEDSKIKTDEDIK